MEAQARVLYYRTTRPHARFDINKSKHTAVRVERCCMTINVSVGLRPASTPTRTVRQRYCCTYIPGITLRRRSALCQPPARDTIKWAGVGEERCEGVGLLQFSPVRTVSNSARNHDATLSKRSEVRGRHHTTPKKTALHMYHYFCARQTQNHQERS